MDNIKTPLLDGLLKYKEEGILRFHMPGHYGNERYTKILKKILFDIDVTEVNGTDNLAEPSGIIKKSLENIAKIYSAKKSYYLVNGSTSGIYVAIDSLTEFGDEIIIARNSHKSVYSICKRKNLKLNFIYPKTDDIFGVDGEVEVENIKKIVENCNAKVIVLTYPNYYGRAFNLEKIYNYVKSENKYLIVDSAHGSTFAFSDDLPEVATKYSDICIHSLHKTLPAFTQISLLSINDTVDEDIIEENIRFYQTTSPSYILMASGEMAVAVMQEKGKELSRLKKAYENAVINLEKISGVKVYKSEYQDFGKLFIKTKLNGQELNDILRVKYKIQSEMVIGNSILFMLGITHSNGDINYLVNSIKNILDNTSSGKFENRLINKNDKVLNNIKIMENNTKEEISKKSNKIKNKKEKAVIKVYKTDNCKEGKYIDVRLANGKICAQDVIPYPPGIPVLLENEIINSEKISELLRLGVDRIKVLII